MKHGKLQCKDIGEAPILIYLHNNYPEWSIFTLGNNHPRDIKNAFPPSTPYKLMLAKMGKLIKQGYVDGCDCGCRGDFVLTNKGLDYIKRALGASKCSEHTGK